jgi:signal transduction histidine kinase
MFLDVKDTGVGVPADKLATLWNSFSQAADPVRRGLEGLGLGLVLVKMIVGLHNGRVWVESQEHHGSSFGFQLPITKEPSGRRNLDAIVMKDIPRPDPFMKTKPIAR